MYVYVYVYIYMYMCIPIIYMYRWEYSTTIEPKILVKINFIKYDPSTQRSSKSESDQRLSI